MFEIVGELLGGYSPIASCFSDKSWLLEAKLLSLELPSPHALLWCVPQSHLKVLFQTLISSCHCPHFDLLYEAEYHEIKIYITFEKKKK